MTSNVGKLLKRFLFFFFGGGGGRGLMLSMLVFYYSRTYASVYGTKENAHALLEVCGSWAKQTHRSEASTQGKD